MSLKKELLQVKFSKETEEVDYDQRKYEKSVTKKQLGLDPECLPLPASYDGPWLELKVLKKALQYYKSCREHKEDVINISYNQDGTYQVKIYLFKKDEKVITLSASEILEINMGYLLKMKLSEALGIPIRFIYKDTNNYAELILENSDSIEYTCLLDALKLYNIFTKISSKRTIYIDCTKIKSALDQDPVLILKICKTCSDKLITGKMDSLKLM
jgi:hypothetical protein